MPEQSFKSAAPATATSGQPGNQAGTSAPSPGLSTRLDKLAVLLSGICILHCLITPVAVTLMPLFLANVMIEDLLFHKAILWLVLPTSCIALLIGCRKHRDFMILGTGIIGMMMLIVIAFYAHELLSPLQEKIATSVSGLVLALSHILNYRACQSLVCADESCSTEHHH